MGNQDFENDPIMSEGADMTVEIFTYGPSHRRRLVLTGITAVFLPGRNGTKLLVAEGDPQSTYPLDRDQRHLELWTNDGKNIEISIVGGGVATITGDGVIVYAKVGYVNWGITGDSL